LIQQQFIIILQDFPSAGLSFTQCPLHKVSLQQI
jgi:hypothetical protein